jgi:DNA-binding beta-propeller fold protein YncE
MRRHLGPIAAAAGLALAIAVAGPAAGAGADVWHHDGGGDHAVFVQRNDPAGNSIAAYHRGANGQLVLDHTYATGGNGAAITGAVVDKLASQDSLAYTDDDGGVLVAVNGGSDTISVFAVDGDHLSLREVLPSGGSLPVSVTIQDHLAYVLNAGGAGAVSGFRLAHGALLPLGGSTRTLGLTPVTGPTMFLNTPGQVGFSPDGSQLIVTTKANGSNIDVWGVRWDGRLTATPVANASATPVPFGFVFDRAGHLVVAEAGASTLTTYNLRRNGTVTPISSVADGQAALCWIAASGSNFYVANAGSGNVSAYKVDRGGNASLGTNTATAAGSIDLTTTPDGQFLYAESGGTGAVFGFHISSNGALTPVGSVTGLGTNLEGIVAL